uniref:Uncharacterized protein n=1 Tax=Cannabis sativa TaxID=3483 RepID=A0A803QQ20_CANSA
MRPHPRHVGGPALRGGIDDDLGSSSSWLQDRQLLLLHDSIRSSGPITSSAAPLMIRSFSTTQPSVVSPPLLTTTAPR